MVELGIEQCSVMGMPPVRFIELAAELGCPNISLGLKQMDFDPFGFPRFSLASDAALRREVKAALAANGVRLALAENLAIFPGDASVDSWKQGLDLLCEMGASRFNSVSFEPDRQLNIDKYAVLAEVAAGYGAAVLLEFVPIFGIPDLSAALEVIAAVGAPNLGLIFDAMHAARTGLAPEDLRAVPAELIGHIQFCDMPQSESGHGWMDADYMDQAMHQRLVPGDGVLPLAAYLRELPLDRVIGLEVPLRDQALAGVPLHESLGRAVAATRALLASLD